MPIPYIGRGAIARISSPRRPEVTVSEAQSAKSLFDKSRRPFLWRKLHSLSGILPVGAFMCFHLFENAKAAKGQRAFDEAVAGISSMPWLPALEATILLPLFFHAIYGVVIALRGKPNVGAYTYSRNWMYALQRVTGLLAFAFIVYHLYGFWWQRVIGKMAAEQFYPMLQAHLSAHVGPVPVNALAYIFGIAACVFHFANGLWGFCFSWGLTVSRRAQQMSAWAFGLVGVVVFVLGADTAVFFATGWSVHKSIAGNEAPAALDRAVTVGPRAAPHPGSR